ncbi:PhzF family phenazine biosynthesis protein [Musicola keenii]|uniref:PhzF family phenazine biosynthesis protein n=1 Tax=Musicola keenii TaxID=2884250 RepID=UPI0017867F81|nr:PhzF family phenazine biosynthesis protein [Musicola keenii]
MSRQRKFKQIDVFSNHPCQGNPLAVILEADGLTDKQLQSIARWTNLSETTFVLMPDDPAADYRVRIFTPSSEIPFAGHPTLGTAYALLEAGLKPRTPGQLIQQCGVGLVPISIHHDGQLAFRAPEAELTTIDPAHSPLIDHALGSHARDVSFPPINVSMGIRWLTVRLHSAQACLDVRPDIRRLKQLFDHCQTDGIAIYGPHATPAIADYEVRTFFMLDDTLIEDPVTGSANACIAQVIHQYPSQHPTARQHGYRVRQGTMLHRNGQVHVTWIDDQPWIGGYSTTLIDGVIRL